MSALKRCGDCGLEKGLECFNKDSKAKDGLFWRCKECARVYATAWMNKLREHWKTHNPFDGTDKRCFYCHAIYPRVAEYWRTAPCKKDGLNNACRQCRSRIDSSSKRKRKYGLSETEVVYLLVDQNFKCASCGDILHLRKRPYEKNGYGHIDHDHKTGAIRGILCEHCNRGLGEFYDSIERLNKAILYLTSSRKESYTNI